MSSKPGFCMLMILDGWGLSDKQEGNAVALARTPFLDKLKSEYQRTSLLCSGEAVGLPEGIMGNSEVGHLNIGAGRVVYQDLLRIDKSISDKSFFENEALCRVMKEVKEKSGSLHFMGLLSDGGVHSRINHLLALIDMAKEKGPENVYIHAILDGRDTPPDSGQLYIRRLKDYIEKTGTGSIASVCGRYYAMDRDNRWERVEKAFRLFAYGEGIKEKDPVDAVRNAYMRGETDEFVKPVAITDENENPKGIIRDGDAVVFFNFRSDRAREITRALTDTGFKSFERESYAGPAGYVCMTQYDEKFTLPVAFPPVHLKEILGEVISGKGLKQLRIAETEKYAHVTYFFNGGEEKPFPLEERCLIPSPRDIPTYDIKPEMSARLVTRELISRLKSAHYDLIVLNFANMDMVGHTGVLKAAINACETIDSCVGEIVEEVKKQGGVLLITADHGNAEMMIDENGHVHTAHTLNPVPLILVDDSRKKAVLRSGTLGDIAPTILEIMEIEKPASMTGNSLLVNC
ncbi:MAG: 2,3-bisphosphoglycerate-independent phosphoglycerate mutase [Thermodesulfobacteriota bacterium]|nr:2,3-bisphosphoglycerate-independent phosphoglycerate mutase [Thermodesulfobacteriota bacterium]